MNNRELIISIDEQERRVAIVENSQLEEFFLQRVGYAQLAGNIYKGRVAQVVKGMEAAFVNIGLEKNGFLYKEDALPRSVVEQEEFPSELIFDETAARNNRFEGSSNIEQILHKNQEVLVQIVKEPFGKKGSRLTSQISLPGRFLVLSPYSRNIGISKKITDERERARLKNLLREVGLPQDTGCIVRTQAAGKGRKEFLIELRYLLHLWRNIKIKASKSSAPCLIHEEYDLILRTARDMFTDDIERMIIDNRDEYRRVWNFVKKLAPVLRSRLKLYQEKIPLFDKYNLEKQIEGIFARQVMLKKGGYIVIEQTEALTSIDVNSGGFTSMGKLEETAFYTNLEAAKEIVHQIKLRDLGGIIVIDFIDMQNQAHKNKVLEVLEKAMQQDKAKVNIYPFSPLGLVQVARQRIRQNTERVTFQDCPVCKGWGRIKSTQSIAINILRQIRNFILLHKRRYVEGKVHPLVAMRFLNEDRLVFTNLEKRLRVKISILTDEHLGIEEVRFL